MKRKHLLLMISCLAALLLAGYATLRLTMPRTIDEENFQAINKGMTEKEVEAILGGACSSHAPLGCLYFSEGGWGNLVDWEFLRNRNGKEWTGKTFCLFICFNEIGRVEEIYSGHVFQSESFLAKFRNWLGM
jgi:hypothetical protein